MPQPVTIKYLSVSFTRDLARCGIPNAGGLPCDCNEGSLRRNHAPFYTPASQASGRAQPSAQTRIVFWRLYSHLQIFNSRHAVEGRGTIWFGTGFRGLICVLVEGSVIEHPLEFSRGHPSRIQESKSVFADRGGLFVCAPALPPAEDLNVRRLLSSTC